MRTTPSFRDLVEVLEDSIVFHGDAARSSMGDLHTLHQRKVFCYTAMLNEARGWEERRKRERSVPAGTGTDESGNDSLSALIKRIDHMYSVQQATSALAAGDSRIGWSRIIPPAWMPEHQSLLATRSQ